MHFIAWDQGLINLEQVTSIDVGDDMSGGQVTFHLTDGNDVVLGTFAGTKADAFLALDRMLGAVDSEIYDTRNY
jgi:hypothetical protein